MAVLVAQLLEREERLDSLGPRLADADQDPAGERDRELACESNRLQAARRDLVRRRPVRTATLGEPRGGRLEHDPHRGGDRPQRHELLARQDAWIQVREQARLLEDERRTAREVLDCRVTSERLELLACDSVAQLGLVSKREERLAAARGSASASDRQHLVLGQVRALPPARRAGERAVPADVAAQRRQRYEDLRRVGDERAGPEAPCLREKLLVRRGEQVGGDSRHRPEHTSSARGPIRRSRKTSRRRPCDSCS